VPSPSDYKYVDMDVKVGMYYYILGSVAVNGSIKWYGPIQVYYGKELNCQGFDIFPSFSSSSFNIEMYIPYKSRYSLRIYDISGRHVKKLVDEIQDARQHMHLNRWKAGCFAVPLFYLFYMEFNVYLHSLQQQIT